MFGIGVDAYRLSVVILVALGIALRVREYASDRSLWLDESLLALNVLDRPLAQLFGHLSFNQAAPPGFLLVERASVALLGPSEYALRLFPLLCGIASLPLFVRFAQSLLRPPGALVALALFAVGDGLIYYSTEVKQYSVDVAASLLVYVAALSLRSPRLPRRRQAAWIVAGFVALSVSYAAAFMVAAVLIAMVVPAVLRSRLKRWRAVDVATVLWTLGLIGAFAYAAPRVSQILASNEHSLLVRAPVPARPERGPLDRPRLSPPRAAEDAALLPALPGGRRSGRPRPPAPRLRGPRRAATAPADGRVGASRVSSPGQVDSLFGPALRRRCRGRDRPPRVGRVARRLASAHSQRLESVSQSSSYRSPPPRIMW